MGSILKKHHGPGSPCPSACVVPCASGPADRPAVPRLQRSFSDPVTYSSLDFSCLDLIILNPLYLIISSPARPDTKLPGASPVASQKDNSSLIYASGGGWPAETGQGERCGDSTWDGSSPAPPVLQPRASEELCCDRFPCCWGCAGRCAPAPTTPGAIGDGPVAHADPQRRGRVALDAEQSVAAPAVLAWQAAAGWYQSRAALGNLLRAALLLLFGFSIVIPKLSSSSSSSPQQDEEASSWPRRLIGSVWLGVNSLFA